MIRDVIILTPTRLDMSNVKPLLDPAWTLSDAPYYDPEDSVVRVSSDVSNSGLESWVDFDFGPAYDKEIRIEEMLNRFGFTMEFPIGGFDLVKDMICRLANDRDVIVDLLDGLFRRGDQLVEQIRTDPAFDWRISPTSYAIVFGTTPDRALPCESVAWMYILSHLEEVVQPNWAVFASLSACRVTGVLDLAKLYCEDPDVYAVVQESLEGLVVTAIESDGTRPAWVGELVPGERREFLALFWQVWEQLALL